MWNVTFHALDELQIENLCGLSLSLSLCFLQWWGYRGGAPQGEADCSVQVWAGKTVDAELWSHPVPGTSGNPHPWRIATSSKSVLYCIRHYTKLETFSSLLFSKQPFCCYVLNVVVLLKLLC